MKRRRPLGRGRSRLKRTKALTARARLRATPFNEKYPPGHDGPRYGTSFRALQARAWRGECWLCDAGYEGPGHTIGRCALGQQTGPTACHVGHNDAEGMIPAGGQGHDLIAGIAGRRAQEHFNAWLAKRGETLKAVGLRYVEEEVWP